MRILLKDSERRPDPAPAKVDERTAMIVGAVAWVVALVLVLVFSPQLAAAKESWWLWTCVTGLALGAVGVVYTQVRHRRGR